MRKSVFVGIVVGLLIGGCSSPAYSNLNPPYTSNEENLVADNMSMRDKIQDQVEDAFPHDAIQVVAKDFNILLLGEVTDQKAKARLTQLVKSQRDVQHVWNYTTVSQNPKLRYNSSIVKDVKARIALEKNIDPEKISVSAIGSVVYLMGTNIGNLTYLNKSIRGIYTIDGVQSVVNLTQVGKNDYYSLDSDSY